MERTREFILPAPIQSAFDRTAQILDEMGWKKTDQEMETYTQKWQIGGYWWFRRRFLTLQFQAVANNRTVVNLSIRDPVLIWGGSNLIEDEADQLVERIQSSLEPVAELK